jgi:Domain of unknown function (DUF4432)
MIEPDKLPNLDQIATATQSIVGDGPATGLRAIDMRVWNGIDARLLPDRGLDVGAAWFLGVPLAWISQTGEGPALPPEELTERRWIDAWQGGLVTTCGLSNVGDASEGWGLHGTYTTRPAADVTVERTDAGVVVTGTIVDAPFTLERKVTTAVGAGLLQIEDRVTNTSEWTVAAPMLYHVNVGAPLWDVGAFLETDAEQVEPRDDDAAAGVKTWDEPPAPADGAPEQVFEHVGATWARLSNAALEIELTVRSSMPRLWQWIHPASGIYALGIEPANCSVLGRAHDIAAGRMPLLDPGETRDTWLAIEARRRP